MRKPKYLSPSGLGTWTKDRDEYYRRYLADNRWPRDPQTQPMAAGSAFDAYVKAYMYKELKLGDDSSYELKTLFEAQVAEEWRDWAWDWGKECFDWYKGVGGLADIMLLCSGTGVLEVEMEFEVRGLVSGPGPEGVVSGPRPTDRPEGIVFMGKPDLCIRRDGGRPPVILDWKVNGACAARRPSPRPGYVNKRGAGRGCGVPYKGAIVAMDSRGDIRCLNIGITGDWGRQLAIYSWVMGAPVGEGWFCCVDQLCLDRNGVENGVLAQHRGVVMADEQRRVWDSALECWNLDWVDAHHRMLDSGPVEIKVGEGVPSWLM